MRTHSRQIKLDLLDEVAEAVEDIPLTLKKRPELLEQKIIAANAAKDRGNGYLKEGAVEEAIEAYSLAIQLDNSNHVFFSNRCAALQQRKMWALAVADAEEVSGCMCVCSFVALSCPVLSYHLTRRTR